MRRLTKGLAAIVGASALALPVKSNQNNAEINYLNEPDNVQYPLPEYEKRKREENFMAYLLKEPLLESERISEMYRNQILSFAIGEYNSSNFGGNIYSNIDLDYTLLSSDVLETYDSTSAVYSESDSSNSE